MKCDNRECDFYTKTSRDHCGSNLPANYCDKKKPLMENKAPSSSPSSVGLDGIADKFKKYFCKSAHCSDSNNKQYPDCEIGICMHRDRIVDDLIEIIRAAD